MLSLYLYKIKKTSVTHDSHSGVYIYGEHRLANYPFFLAEYGLTDILNDPF